jgi:CubicO group peptidase (beta-lactamase class C family)
MRLGVILLLWAAVQACAVALPAFALELPPEVDAQARALIRERFAIGFVVGIVKDGETRVSAYGETVKGSGIAPNGDTVYEIGSITKVFTGILLADQLQRGMVKLDAPVQDYLPPAAKLRSKDGVPVTLQHLATHTSGLPRRPGNMFPADAHNPYADYSVRQLYEALGQDWLRRAPGQYEYSNFAMGLLGHVLELQAGKSYEALLAERICEPLGMHDTRPVATAAMLARLAPPYDETLRLAKNWDLPVLAGAGGVRSTVNDMLKFIQANLAGGDTALAQAMRLSHRRRYTMANGVGIGLGWRLSPNQRILFHSGGTGGYRAWLAVVPSRNAGVVVLANTAESRIVQFGDKAIHIVSGTPAPQPLPGAAQFD